MENFHVEPLTSKSLRLLGDASFLQLLQKWSLEKMHISAWAFNESYHPNREEKLYKAVAKKCEELGISLPYTNVLALESVPVTVTKTDFLERLKDPENNVVHRCGDNIRGCFEEDIDGFIVSDNLRQLLLNNESSIFNVYLKEERGELIFRILKHLALGGGEWCQYEDVIQPYIDMTLKVYKHLLSVQKDPETNEVTIRSKCFSVKLPHLHNPLDFIYLLIDPPLREATLFAYKA